MQLFYDQNIAICKTLNEEESYHCTKVLRLRSDSIIYITDGIGNLYKTKITEINQKQTKVEILETINNYRQCQYYNHIAIAPTKNIDRFEWFIEKATEIGINEITPIICKNSERRVVKIDRLKKIAISAMKQSCKAHLPKINELISFQDFITKNRCTYNDKYIAHCINEEKIYLGRLIKKKTNYLILIGPEGDFSTDEILLATNNKYIPVSLCESRLRTETAAIVACGIVSIINNL